MSQRTKNILIINGSLGGADGNTSVVIEAAKTFLAKHPVEVRIIHLENFQEENIETHLNWANGFIFTSGTYWDSWGSPLQKFLETTAKTEPASLLFKPASVLITMHSVGGKGVLSRLQGVLNTIGLIIPPMSGFVYSLASHMALNSKDMDIDQTFNEDFWSLEDIEIVIHNLISSVYRMHDYKTWPIDKKDPRRRWL